MASLFGPGFDSPQVHIAYYIYVYKKEQKAMFAISAPFLYNFFIVTPIPCCAVNILHVAIPKNDDYLGIKIYLFLSIVYF